ncbi:MAG: hypothetical protein KC427_09115 [Sulfurovum sp.]|uniref:asparagine synthase-related protein n=1 Tax=Sulfurovum sp. TaxID=1969726 RepID=UPI002867B318|nr:asparagine synthase-related protein [Sulfurovum sp.]MCO4846164.1 hypothetical protein [Sulfurovum sp.]
MSGIFGIFNRNGNAVDKQIVETMLEATSYWEPDESGTWINGPVVLGHTMLWNTPESKYEHLPLEKDVLVLTMDARIDNREELARDLELPNRPLEEVGDSEFILAAYVKWGEACPKYLVGDFAFAIWDEKKQQLFCARDHVGVKQFYYHLKDDLFVFGNDLKGLVHHPDISKDINDEAVANYIVNDQLLSSTMTFFENIKKLPPAHTLTITNLGMDEKCYWKLEDAPKIKLPNAEAYAKKLRELLEQAVHDRMRSDYPITSHLSGGIDSSSIAAIAARKLKDKGQKLLAFNWLHEPTETDDPTQHEWSNSKMIAEAEGIDHRYVSLSVNDMYHNMQNDTIIFGHSARFWYEYPVRQSAQKKGSRTILSGWGGDDLSTYHGQAYYANLFLKGSWWKLFQELQIKAYKKRKSIKSMVSAIYHHVCVPLVPRSLYCKIPKITCLEGSSFTFIKKSFLPLVKVESKKPSVLTMQPQRTIRKHMLAYWNYGHIQSRIESWATAANTNRLEYSYPLLDKRIIEFILGVPAEYFVSNGVGRHLFRSAAEGLLPEKILWTNAKLEPKRVERLISLTLSVFKLLVSDGSINDKQSKYIDNKRLIKLLEKFDYPSMDRDTIEMIMEMETSLDLVLSLGSDGYRRENTSS